MNRTLLLLLAAALPLGALAQAPTYKWKDEHGRVHYSEVPPKGVKEFETIMSAPPAGTAPNQDALNQSLEAARQAQQAQDQAAQLAAQQQAQRDQLCKEAIERVAWLDSHPPNRLMTQDAEGNRTRMSDEEHAKQRAQAQERMDQNCE